MMGKIVNTTGDSSSIGQQNLFPSEASRTKKNTSFWVKYQKWMNSTVFSPERKKICSPFFQIFVIITSVLVYFLDPATRITDWGMRIAPGSIYFSYWKSPPTKIFTKFFFFNITNGEEFLDGREKLRVEEIGPFVYEEKWIINNVTFNDNNTVTYHSQKLPIFAPELSIGDPKKIFIITPDVPFIGMASLLANRSSVTNFSFMSAARYLGATTFKNLSVYEFAWGYNDPLIKLANTFVSSWIPFEKMGILDRVYDEGTNWVTIRSEDNGLSPEEPGYLPQYSIDNYNGIPGVRHWGFREEDYVDRETPLRPKPIEECKIIRGATESILFPRHMDRRIISQIFRKPFCRNIPVGFTRHEKLYPGIWTDRYDVPEGVLDSPVTNERTRCFCDPAVKECPVGGFHDISPCFYQVPLTVSWPHFREVDPEEMDKIEGLKPNKTRHASFVVVQPSLGIVTDAAERIQLNLWVKNIRAIPMLRPVANRQIPLFWAELGPSEITTFTVLLMYILLWILPGVQAIVITFGCIASFWLVFVLLNQAKATLSKKLTKKEIFLTHCHPPPQL